MYYFAVLGHQQKICWLNVLIGKVGFLVYYVKYILLIKQNSHRMIEKWNEWCHSRNIYNRWNVISLSNVWYAEESEGKMLFCKVRAENTWCWKSNSLNFLFMFLNSLHFTLYMCKNTHVFLLVCVMQHVHKPQRCIETKWARKWIDRYTTEIKGLRIFEVLLIRETGCIQ